MFKSTFKLSFIKSVLLLILFFTSSILSAADDTKKNDLVVVNGSKYFDSTVKAVDMLGGMEKFVPKGSKVGLLINSDFEDKGVYVNPDISIAVIKMCFDAGAKDVVFIQAVQEEYWKRSGIYEQYKEMIHKCINTEANRFPAQFDPKYFVKTQIPDAISLKESEIVKVLFDCDVFINIPIAKHHAVTNLTCALKNIMGINTRASNVHMHIGGKTRTDLDWFAQCIADLHLVKKTDLCIVDATEFIITNGPSGPGEMRKLDKVVAGTDIVAIDAYCAGLLDYSIDDVLAIDKAYKHGLGEKDLSKVKIVEYNF